LLALVLWKGIRRLKRQIVHGVVCQVNLRAGSTQRRLKLRLAALLIQFSAFADLWHISLLVNKLLLSILVCKNNTYRRVGRCFEKRSTASAAAMPVLYKQLATVFMNVWTPSSSHCSSGLGLLAG
jgi:hypothetical protein